MNSSKNFKSLKQHAYGFTEYYSSFLLKKQSILAKTHVKVFASVWKSFSTKMPKRYMRQPSEVDKDLLPKRKRFGFGYFHFHVWVKVLSSFLNQKC